jgi:BirA family transcriptional regulator, biotin operon repressor / biotin---[acetyl-CoA-carboxylase] ligase
MLSLSKHAGFLREHVDSIGSTNQTLLDRAALGEIGPLWLTAGQQLTGRGRAARQWASPPGNLYASLLLTDPCPMREAPGLGFVAGVALHRALRTIAPNLKAIALKWPNDVLVNGAKIAGILPEARQVNQCLAIVIGMGVNCAFHPEGTPYPATSLAAEGAPVSPDHLMAALNPIMAQTLDLFDEGRGLRAILDLWRMQAHGIGTIITVKPPGGAVSGIFEGIANDGTLLLRQGSALTRISAGDVYFSANAALGAAN